MKKTKINYNSTKFTKFQKGTKVWAYNKPKTRKTFNIAIEGEIIDVFENGNKYEVLLSNGNTIITTSTFIEKSE